MSAQNKSLDSVRDGEMARCLADTYEQVFYAGGDGDNDWLRIREGGFKVGFELSWSACLAHLASLGAEFDEQAATEGSGKHHHGTRAKFVEGARWQHQQDAAWVGSAISEGRRLARESISSRE